MNFGKNKKTIGIVFSTLILFGLSSCSGSSVSSNRDSSSIVSSETQKDSTNSQYGLETMSSSNTTVDFNSELTTSVVDKEVKTKDKQVNYDKSTSKIINLSDGSTNFTGSGIKVEGNKVTITEAGTYVLSGTLSDGQVIVDVTKEDDVILVLENVNIHSEKSTAIYVKKADKVVITLPNGTTSTLSGGATYENIDDNNIDAVLFSKDDLTINGSGILNINANYKHGIVSKNDLNILGGTYNIKSVSQALSSKDAVKIYDGTFNIESKGKGIKSDNADETEKGNIYISGGTFNLNTEDDSIHTGGSVVIDGGEFNIKTGDDGIHADKDVVINNGTINITESYEGVEGYKVVINGGTLNINSSDDAINAAKPNSASSDESINGVSNMPERPQGDPPTFSESEPGSRPTPPDQAQSNANGSPPSGMNKGGGRGFEGPGMSNDINAYIKITGGNISITAGGDGLDSNGSILITGGDIFVSNVSNTSDSPIDYDGSFRIEGGTLVAVGGSGMMHNFTQQDGSTQRSIFYGLSSQQSKGSTIKLTDSTGKEILSWEVPLNYNTVIISTPELKEGQTYKLQAGTETFDITLNDLVTTNGMSMGGRRGQRQKFDDSSQRMPVDQNVSNENL